MLFTASGTTVETSKQQVNTMADAQRNIAYEMMDDMGSYADPRPVERREAPAVPSLPVNPVSQSCA